MQYKAKDLNSAIRINNIQIVELILKENPSLLHLETPLGSWLHIATDHGNKEIVKLLLNSGLDVNTQGGSSKRTSINLASYSGNVDLVQFLLNNGALLDVSEPDRNPLFAAIHGGHRDVVEILLNAGIDADVRYTGNTMKDMGAIDFAKEWGRQDIADLLEKRK
jgi:ankyrin repeat protein